MKPVLYVLLAAGAVVGVLWLVERQSREAGPLEKLCKLAGGSAEECAFGAAAIEELSQQGVNLTTGVTKGIAGAAGRAGILPSNEITCPAGMRKLTEAESQRRCAGMSPFGRLRDVERCRCAPIGEVV